MQYNLEPIIDYNMTKEEALAYKLGCIWLQYSREIFPNCKHVKGFPKKGDPRKSSLFRYCYTLQRETKGLIPENDLKLYIISQLKIFKAIKIDNMHPLVTPQILIGNKAWIRWKMFKRKYDKINKIDNSEELVNLPVDKIKLELIKTKHFLESKMGEAYTENKFKENANNISIWIELSKITGYYAVLSPFSKKYCNFNLDRSMYMTNKNIEILFGEIFTNELI